jgi:hypothetical protein
LNFSNSCNIHTITTQKVGRSQNRLQVSRLGCGRERETQESKDSTTFILPGSCTSQGAISLSTGHSSFGLGWSSCGSVGPKVARGWTVLFPGITCSCRRSSFGVGDSLPPWPGFTGWCLHEVVWQDVGRRVRRNRTK